MKYLVVLVDKDAESGRACDIALFKFKIVEATSPNEALANWTLETEEEKTNPDSWYAMAMDVPFIENAISSTPSVVGSAFMNLDDENTYDFIVVELDAIEPGKEYGFLVTVPENANYDISY